MPGSLHPNKNLGLSSNASGQWVESNEPLSPLKKTEANASTQSLLIGLLVLVVLVLFTKFGTPYNQQGRSWIEVLDHLPMLVLISSVIGAVRHFRDKIRAENQEPPEPTVPVMCNECYIAKMGVIDQECECGGVFVDQRRMKWVKQAGAK